MNKAIDWIAKKYFDLQFKRYTKALSSYEEYQNKTLLSLLKSAENTVIGKRLKFESLFDYRSFSLAVPIHDYEDLHPFIESMLAGNQNILWPEINQFSRSSGTTSGKSKFLPISTEALVQSHIQTGKNYLANYLHRLPKSRFFYGKGIVLTGSFYPNHAGGDALIADVSMLLYKHTDTWINFFKSLPLAVASLEDWEDKLDKIAEISIPQNITNISGVPSWMLLLLRKVLEKSGKKSIAEVWPNLELITHGGVDFTPYQIMFEKLIQKPIHYRNVYNASEGFFAFQPDEESTLAFDFSNQIFYELEHAISKQVVLPQNATIGQRYTLIVSTNAGLWRYRMGDQLEVSSIHPFRFRLVGRAVQCINIAGEELIQANTDKAIAICCERWNAILTEYTVAPLIFEHEKIACHEWAIEFDVPPIDMGKFAADLDATLCSLNSDYEAKRSKDLALAPLRIHLVESGVFFSWLRKHNRLRVQAKVPRLSMDRCVLEEITSC